MTTTRTRPSLAALAGLNIALVAVLALVTLWTPAPVSAQGSRTRAKGQYTLVSGRAQGITENVAHIIDAANEQMVAMRYDRSKKGLLLIGHRDLRADAQLRGQKGGGGR